MAGEDGSIHIGVQIDDSAATKSLKQLASSAEKLGKAINGNETKHNALAGQLEQIRAQLSETYAEMDMYQEKIARFQELSTKGTNTPDETMEYMALAGEVGEAQQLLDEKTKAAEKLEQQEAKVKAQDEEILQKLQQQRAELEKQQGLIGDKLKADAEQGTQAVSELKEETKSTGETAAMAMPNFNKLFKTILRYGFGIRSTFILFRKLKQAVIEGYTEMAKTDAVTKQNLVEFKSALAGLKGAFGAAFAPILNAVVPVLTTLIEWLTKAMNAIQAFFAVLGGKSSYKKAVANTAKIEKNLSGAAGSASDLKKQLMSIDELNILSSNNGGGGGSDSDYEYIDEMINGESFASKLAISFKDVFFDWDDLTKEQIAKKVITGLTAIAGGIIGFSFGGVGGAIIGTIAGVALGLIISALTFDNDGEISANELADMIRMAIGAMVGGALGFVFGGVVGAAIGAVMGVVLTLMINKLEWVNNAREEQMQYRSKADWFVCGVLGLPTDAEVMEWLKKNIWQNGILAFFEELLTLVTGNNYAGLTGEQLIEQLKNGLSGTYDALSEWWDTNVAPWFTWDKWRELGQAAIKGIKDGLSSLRIPTFHFSWDWQSYTGSFFGNPVTISIPYPNLAFYARGGIVDSATLFGSNVVGEAGKEAIVPLERHTEWISLVAEGLLEEMMSSNALERLAQAFSNVALPAMAMGGIVPPGIQSLDDSLKGISDTLERVVDMLGNLGANNASNGGDYRFYLDGKEISAVVSRYQRQSARANGV